VEEMIVKGIPMTSHDGNKRPYQTTTASPPITTTTKERRRKPIKKKGSLRSRKMISTPAPPDPHIYAKFGDKTKIVESFLIINPSLNFFLVSEKKPSI
jgi:hypothetical protein